MTTRNPTPAKRPRRASQRLVVSINLAEDALRHRMIEQCRSGSGGYLTVYRGSRVELVGAGVPEAAFPNGGAVAKFQVQTVNVCCTGSRELLTGSMCLATAGYELEIDWGHIRPYMQAAHPAVCELARMLLKDVCAWTSDRADLAQPIDMLAADPRAVDYKPCPGAPRLQVTPEFHKELRSYASRLFELVHSNCEVLPQTETEPVQTTQRTTMHVVGGTAHG